MSLLPIPLLHSLELFGCELIVGMARLTITRLFDPSLLNKARLDLSGAIYTMFLGRLVYDVNDVSLPSILRVILHGGRMRVRVPTSVACKSQTSITPSLIHHFDLTRGIRLLIFPYCWTRSLSYRWTHTPRADLL